MKESLLKTFTVYYCPDCYFFRKITAAVKKSSPSDKIFSGNHLSWHSAKEHGWIYICSKCGYLFRCSEVLDGLPIENGQNSSE